MMWSHGYMAVVYASGASELQRYIIEPQSKIKSLMGPEDMRVGYPQSVGYYYLLLSQATVTQYKLGGLLHPTFFPQILSRVSRMRK